MIGHTDRARYETELGSLGPPSEMAITSKSAKQDDS